MAARNNLPGNPTTKAENESNPKISGADNQDNVCQQFWLTLFSFYSLNIISLLFYSQVRNPSTRYLHLNDPAGASLISKWTHLSDNNRCMIH